MFDKYWFQLSLFALMSGFVTWDILELLPYNGFDLWQTADFLITLALWLFLFNSICHHFKFREDISYAKGNLDGSIEILAKMADVLEQDSDKSPIKPHGTRNIPIIKS